MKPDGFNKLQKKLDANRNWYMFKFHISMAFKETKTVFKYYLERDDIRMFPVSQKNLHFFFAISFVLENNLQENAN